jgi:hypothetical protein
VIEELSDLKNCLIECKESKVTHLILSGLFNYNGKNYQTVMDRSLIKFKNIKELLELAKELKIKVIFEFPMRIGTIYPAKQYQQRFLKECKNGENLKMKAGFDLKKYEDLKYYSLNYSDFRNWEFTLKEICLTLGQFGELIDGVCIEKLGSLPLIFKRDLNELKRKEIDGQWSNEDEEIKYGYTVVKSNSFYLGESCQAFLKFLTSRIRNFTKNSTKFCVLDDTAEIDLKNGTQTIQKLNLNGVQPLVRDIVDPSNNVLNINHVFAFRSVMIRFNSWIKKGLKLIFAYDSCQEETIRSYTNLMIILLSRTFCQYESLLPQNANSADYKFVNQSRYQNLFKSLSNASKQIDSLDQVSAVYAFQEKSLSKKVIGLSFSGSKVVLANMEESHQTCIINVKEIINKITKTRKISRGKELLKVTDCLSGAEEFYDNLEVLKNGLIADFKVKKILKAGLRGERLQV